MKHQLFAPCLLMLGASGAFAFDGVQAPAPQPPLAFPAPASDITVATDVEYGVSGATRLAMDLYKPDVPSGTKVPALVFFNRATGAARSERFYASWAKAAASKGLIGICVAAIDSAAVPPAVGGGGAGLCRAEGSQDFRALFERK